MKRINSTHHNNNNTTKCNWRENEEKKRQKKKCEVQCMRKKERFLFSFIVSFSYEIKVVRKRKKFKMHDKMIVVSLPSSLSHALVTSVSRRWKKMCWKNYNIFKVFNHWQ